MAPKIQGLLFLGQNGVGRMPYFEVVGFKVSLDSNGDRTDLEIWRRKIKAHDADLARIKGEKWERRNFLKSCIDDHVIEVRPIPIRDPKPIVPIQRPPVCRVSAKHLYA